MPITTLLFDLDDTLLGNDIDKFIKPYLQSFAAHTAPVVEPQAFVGNMLAGVQAMIGDRSPRATLKDKFGAAFYPLVGVAEAQLEPRLNSYYEQVYPKLRSETQVVSAAREVVQWAFEAGYRVVIATNALFPRSAILQRLDWAGVSASEFPFTLITTYEHMHFAKPSPEYYAEILTLIEARPEEAMMIGNDWSQDIEPAQALGIQTWWAPARGEAYPNGNSSHTGTLPEFLTWAQTPGQLESLPTLPMTARGVQAQQAAALAILFDLTKSVSVDTWQRRPRETEWSLTEIACHLRDAEVEINLPRLEKVLEETNPFISAVDADSWAAERGYQSQSGLAAMADFADARERTLARLDRLTDEEWLRRARHAVFGPTTLQELVSFTNEHDRLHIKQMRENLATPL